ncbi:MAG TPA: hypothetical protein VGI39_30085 [Polyangiaceae bacterium]|jgi:hypothetical protein
MRRAVVLGMLGALACALAACTALVGLGPAPSAAEGPDASDTGGGSVVEGGAAQVDSALAMDAGDATTAPEGTDASNATSDAAIAIESGLDAGPSLLLSSGAVLRLEGITSDGWVVYQDPSDSAVHALPLSGGTPVRVAPGLNSAIIQGKVALVYASTTPQWTMTAWTSATGSHAQPSVGSWAISGTKASADGSRLVYPALDATGSTQYHLLQTNLDFTSPIDLGPVVGAQFEVYVTGDRFVVSREVLAADGAATYSCDAYSNAGAPEHLFDGSCAGAAGSEAFSSDYGVDGITALLAEGAHGGAIQSFSPQADAGTITSFAVTPDGGGLVFADSAGNLWSSSLPNSMTSRLPNTTSFASSSWIAMAADGAHFYFGNTSNVLLVASVTDGNAVAPHPLGDGSISYVAFGSDSRFFVFKEGSELEVTEVASNVTAHIADNVTCEQIQGSCFLPARDSRIVYLSAGDLWAVDVRDAAHPTMLARSVVQFVLDPTGGTVVYRFKDSSGDDQSGLYAVAVP